ncbi:hypothetical protein HD554DRAFT_2041004 [Boletus coccyginus]|nr:hypothetical protein HD554DRAFT_2041004 [Boletus coccyginus]
MALRDEKPHVGDHVSDGGGIQGESSGSFESVVDGSLPLPLLVGKVGIFPYFLRGGGSYGGQQDASEPEDLHGGRNEGGGTTGSGVLVHHARKCDIEVDGSRAVARLSEMDVGDVADRYRLGKPLGAPALVLISGRLWKKNLDLTMVVFRNRRFVAKVWHDVDFERAKYMEMMGDPDYAVDVESYSDLTVGDGNSVSFRTDTDVITLDGVLSTNKQVNAARGILVSGQSQHVGHSHDIDVIDGNLSRFAHAIGGEMMNHGLILTRWVPEFRFTYGKKVV